MNNILFMLDNVIIIPYRARQKQLDYYMKNAVPIIEQHMPNTKIVIVEQEKSKMFNKGAIMNVGFKEYKDMSKYFIQQDIDIVPKVQCIKEYYNSSIENDSVLCILTSPCNTLGGIWKMSNPTIHIINGYPNDFWGWGVEDKALQCRSELYNIKKKTIFIRNDKKADTIYFKCFDDIGDRQKYKFNEKTKFYYNIYDTLPKTKKQNLLNSNGINNLKYNIIERKNLHKIVELIKVKI